MSLNEVPQQVEWPQTHYVFVEKVGPFQQNAWLAWQTAHGCIEELQKHNRILRQMSLYKPGPQIYRAGFALQAPPVNLPQGMAYELFRGGAYSRFVLTGSYSQLPQASGRVWDLVAQNAVPLRDDFAIEHYVNNPATTPEEELVTEILIPTAD